MLVLYHTFVCVGKLLLVSLPVAPLYSVNANATQSGLSHSTDGIWALSPSAMTAPQLIPGNQLYFLDIHVDYEADALPAFRKLAIILSICP